MTMCLIAPKSEERLKRHPLKDRDVLLVVTVRNEMLRLPWFFEYYRKAGIQRFLVIDNDSEDGTSEYCDAQPDALVFAASGSYAASQCGVLWVNEILDAFAPNHWALTVDADELLIYPDCERLNIIELTRLLDESGADAMIAPMLDMYPKGPLSSNSYRPGADFLDHSAYFDPGPYEFKIVGDQRVIARGGPRQRVFWEGRGLDHNSPYLFKMPLVRWNRGMAYKASTHILEGPSSLASTTGLLLHFKFLPDFARKAEIEVGRGEHFAGARQYAAYAQIVKESPDVRVDYEGSVRYKNSSQLVEMGLMNKKDR